ncbi:MAG: hypothetical protein IKE73_04500 [Bacilli bacterium]|nr:hypothetical protein [Bacilli bacterium]
MENRNFKKKTGIKVALAGSILAVILSVASCTHKKSNDETKTIPSVTPTVTELPKEDNNITVTPIPTPEVVEVGLNIDNNESIESTVEISYDEFKDFYDSKGINRDQIRDVIFVLNDKYTDEDGNLIINEDRVHEAYSNMRDILYSDEIINKIGIIDAKEAGIDIDDNYIINNHPSLVNLVDINKAGGAATASKIADYEKIRDAEILKMNTEGKYDKDIIISYIIDNSINDVNGNKDNMDDINKNGQKFVVAATKFYGLQFAASTNSQTEYIKVGEDGVSDIKINPNEKERKMIADYYQYLDEGIDLPDQLAADYIEYLNKKLDTGYFRVMCDEEAEAVYDVNSLGINNVKTLTYK